MVEGGRFPLLTSGKEAGSKGVSGHRTARISTRQERKATRIYCPPSSDAVGPRSGLCRHAAILISASDESLIVAGRRRTIKSIHRDSRRQDQTGRRRLRRGWWMLGSSRPTSPTGNARPPPLPHSAAPPLRRVAATFRRASVKDGVVPAREGDWWAWMDSNQRPRSYQDRALTA